MAAARRVWRTVRVTYRVTRQEPAAFASFVLSLPRDPNQAVSVWPEGPLSRLGHRLAMFVHYDAEGEVAPRVLQTLDRLREAGLAILVVSNAGALRAEAEVALRARCAGILIRRNIGYDFGAMREGLHHWREPIARAELLVIINDSVLGPFAPLAPLLERIDLARADVWGATDSVQRTRPLQTWFLAVGRRALDHPAWSRFWSGGRPVRAKAWVIGRYEVGLSRALRDSGLRLAALFGYESLVEAARRGAAADSPAALRQADKIGLLLQRGY